MGTIVGQSEIIVFSVTPRQLNSTVNSEHRDCKLKYTLIYMQETSVESYGADLTTDAPWIGLGHI